MIDGDKQLLGISVRTIALIGSALMVFAASIAASLWLPVPEFFKGLSSIPAVAALSGVLYQLWRDSRAHERALELQSRQQDFALATASHMANVVYDKHVVFCEAYMSRTNQGLGELFAQGPGMAAYQMGVDLGRIRVEHRTWLTGEIENKLIPFEDALRGIGGDHALLEHLEVGEQRTKVVEAMYRAFGIVTAMAPPVSEEEQERTSLHVIDALRRVLGTQELTQLRQETAAVALARLGE